MRTFNYNDLYISALNNQNIIYGTSVVKNSDKTTYFILGIYGATVSNVVTVKRGSNTIFTLTQDMDFSYPIIFRAGEGGFDVSAATSIGVEFCKFEH